MFRTIISHLSFVRWILKIRRDIDRPTIAGLGLFVAPQVESIHRQIVKSNVRLSPSREGHLSLPYFCVLYHMSRGNKCTWIDEPSSNCSQERRAKTSAQKEFRVELESSLVLIAVLMKLVKLSFESRSVGAQFQWCIWSRVTSSWRIKLKYFDREQREEANSKRTFQSLDNAISKVEGQTGEIPAH